MFEAGIAVIDLAPAASPSSTPVTAAHHARLAAADSSTPIWCQVSGTAWQKACTARAGAGRERSRRGPEHARGAERDEGVARVHGADADGAGRVVARAAGDQRRALEAPARRDPFGAELAGDRVAFDQARHLLAAHAGGGERRLGPARVRRRRATACPRRPTFPRCTRRTGASARRPWAAAPSPRARRLPARARAPTCSLGAVKPGIARLPVTACSAGQSRVEALRTARRCGRRSRGCRDAAPRPASSSSVAPCIWPDRPMAAVSASSRRVREPSARPGTRSAACHQSLRDPAR